MTVLWEALAARTDGLHIAEDFEIAAYRLVAEQALYYSDRSSRTYYYVIERFERDFKEALAPLGVDVFVNRQLRYAYAIPRHGKSGTATTIQTLFALVLRLIYEEYAKVGDLTDDGEVLCDLVELQEKFRILTGRDLPNKGELDTLMRTMKRWGLARLSTEDEKFSENDLNGQPYAIAIRPAIVDILGEAALARLSQWPRQSIILPDLEADSTNDADSNTYLEAE